jgi:hypothetical protein
MRSRKPDFSPEFLRSIMSYDPKTGKFAWLVRTSIRISVGDPVGFLGNNGYLATRIDGRYFLLHRLAWYHLRGEWPPEQIDHINQNRTDNRIDNLRLANNQQNSFNSTLKPTNTSGFRGVARSKAGTWRARIMINGADIYLGSFKTKENAALAYNFAAHEHFGPFAKFNRATP